MKSIFFSFLFILLLFPILLNSYIFEVDRRESMVYLSTALAFDLSNNYFDRQLIDKPSDLELNSLSENNVIIFDRIAFQPYSKKLKLYSDYAAYFNIGATLYAVYEDDLDVISDNLFVLSEILITQSAITKWIKTLSHRFRPFVYDEDISLDKKKQRNSQHSFPSMHSSTVFASATYGYYYYSQQNGRNYYMMTVLYGSAAATSILRVASAQHFPSDVVAGAVIGSSISYFICKFHQNKNISISLNPNKFKISYKF